VLISYQAFAICSAEKNQMWWNLTIARATDLLRHGQATAYDAATGAAVDAAFAK